MDDALGVRGVERVRDLDRQGERRVVVQRLTTDACLERFSLEQLHHQVWAALRFAHVIDGANVGVVQRGGGARLALKALPRGVVREPFWEDLESYVATEAGVASFVHFTHAARPNSGNDLVWSQTGAGGKEHKWTFSLSLHDVVNDGWRSIIPPASGTQSKLNWTFLDSIESLSSHLLCPETKSAFLILNV